MLDSQQMTKKRIALTLMILLALCLCASVWAQDEIPRPMTLADAFRIALERNPSVAAARSELKGRGANLDAQKARWLPTLSAGWDWRTQQSLPRPINIGGGTISLISQRTTTRDLALTLSQTFYQSGLSEAIGVAHQQVQASGASLEDARRQLLKQVAATYHTILADRELAHVADEAVSAAERHLELVNARIEAGTAAPADRLSVEAELADARYESVRTINAVWQALAELQALLALPPETLPMLDEAPQLDYSHGKLENWIDEALAQRPDMIAQQHQVRAVGLSVTQAKIATGVSLSVVGQASYGKYTGTTGESWWVGAGASFPLHDRQAQAEVDQAWANLQTARHRLSELELSVTREVAQAWYALGDASEGVVAAEASVQAATTNLDSTREQYAAGVTDIIKVTDAELNWRRARGQLVQARYDRNVAYYNLLAGSGRLLTESDTTTPTEQGETVIEQ